mgnify:CR=1 FL=1
MPGDPRTNRPFLRGDFSPPARVMISDVDPGDQDPTTGHPKWDAVPPYRDLCGTKRMPTLVDGDAGRSLMLPVAWEPNLELPRGEFWVNFGTQIPGRMDARWHGPYKVRAADQAFALIQERPQYGEASIVYLELMLLA